MGEWIFGVVMALLSMIGLFMASRAHDGVLEWAGYLPDRYSAPKAY